MSASRLDRNMKTCMHPQTERHGRTIETYARWQTLARIRTSDDGIVTVTGSGGRTGDRQDRRHEFTT
jgi:hypothetical protein